MPKVVKEQEEKKASPVSSIAMMFRKKVNTVTEDVSEAKLEHRQGIKGLVETYYEDVKKGKADGIRNAKELVEMVKLDLLLMGESTEITESKDAVDDMQVTTIQHNLNPDDPEVQDIVNKIFKSLNIANDSMDDAPVYSGEGEVPDDLGDIAIYSKDTNDIEDEIVKQSMVNDSKDEDTQIINEQGYEEI